MTPQQDTDLSPAEPAPALVDADLGTLPTEHLEARICEWAAQVAAADCLWLEMIAEFDRREGWKHWGMASCAHWLSWKCALAPPAARERVRVARAVLPLPLIHSAFRRGRLSYSKVRAITRVPEECNEAELLDLAIHSTAHQLELIVRAWRNCLEANNLDRAKAQYDKRVLQWHHDDDGCLVGKFRLPPDGSDVFVKGISDLMAPPPPRAERDVSAETPTVAQRRADALVEMANTALHSAGRPGGERVMTVVEVEAATLAVDEPGRCEVSGTAISAETARRLACEAIEMFVVVDANGDEMGTTKPTRTIPRRIRRALQRRDSGRCVFPDCPAHGRVEAHHIVHRAHGGSHELENLVTLCKHHHHLVHEGGYRVAAVAEGSAFHFFAPTGRLIESSAEITVDSGQSGLHQALDQRGVDVTPSTLAGGDGDRLDLELTVWALGTRYRNRVGVSAETPQAPAASPLQTPAD